MFEAMRDADVMRYWSTAPHSRVEETSTFLAKMLVGYAVGSALDDYLVEHDGAVVGKAGFWRGSEIGFLFRASAQGRGLAREALNALISRGFGARGFSEIHAEVDPENARCLRLLTGLGFEVSRFVPHTLHIAGAWRDSLELSLAPRAWKSG